MKSRSKITLFSNECHIEIWFSKKKTITFFWSKLSKLHKKDPILHVTTTVSLKQGETRTSSGPIPHPLRLVSTQKFWKIRECHIKLLNYNCDVYKSIHFWNVNESENPFLISNFTKNDDFLRKWQKITFLVKKNSWTAYKKQFWVKNAELVENHVKTKV